MTRNPREVLAEFWELRGDSEPEEYAEALTAAYRLCDSQEFANVLCEVASAHEGAEVIWDAVTLFLLTQTLNVAAR